MQKVARVNGPGKPKGKGQERTFEQQSQKIGLCTCTKLKYSTFVCLISKKSICQGKNCFLSKTKANLVSWQPKN